MKNGLNIRAKLKQDGLGNGRRLLSEMTGTQDFFGIKFIIFMLIFYI